MTEDQKDGYNLLVHILAVLGLLFLGYVLVEGKFYYLLALFGLMIGLGLYWKLK